MSSREDQERLWADHVAGWQSSGLTRQAYCMREGLSLGTFSYWRARLAKRSRPSDAAKLSLVPVRIRQAVSDGPLVLRSPAGWTVALPASASIDWVAGILKHLP